jgi:Lrp/AsnC family transcriptional regulator, leucine-responsive regulatory protein
MIVSAPESSNRKSASQRNGRVDDIDVRLLNALRHNGRRSQEELSQMLSLSRPAVRERMRRLEANGILARYTVEIDWERLGYPLLAFIHVRTKSGDCRTYAQQVMELSNEDATIEACHRITGKWCLLVKVRARTSADLEELLAQIRSLPNGARTATTLALGIAPVVYG